MQVVKVVQLLAQYLDHQRAYNGQVLRKMSMLEKKVFKPAEGEKPWKDGKYYRKINGINVGFEADENMDEAIRRQVPKDRLGDSEKPKQLSYKDIGLRDQNYGFGERETKWQDTRQKGNEILARLYTELNPNTKEVYDETVMNGKNVMQRTMAASEKEINQLLEWQKDKGKTWKWKIPLTDGDDYNNPKSDSETGGFTHDVSNHKYVTIMLIKPDDYFTLMEGGKGEHHKPEATPGYGNEEFHKKLDRLAEQMVTGGMNTPHIDLDKDYKFAGGQEGRHRAMAAKKAGIKWMPVYVVDTSRSKDPMETRQILYDKLQEKNGSSWLHESKESNKPKVEADKPKDADDKNVEYGKVRSSEPYKMQSAKHNEKYGITLDRDYNYVGDKVTTFAMEREDNESEKINVTILPDESIFMARDRSEKIINLKDDEDFGKEFRIHILQGRRNVELLPVRGSNTDKAMRYIESAIPDRLKRTMAKHGERMFVSIKQAAFTDRYIKNVYSIDFPWHRKSRFVSTLQSDKNIDIENIQAPGKEQYVSRIGNLPENFAGYYQASKRKVGTINVKVNDFDSIAEKVDKLKKAIDHLSISQKSEFKPEPGEKPDENGDYWRTINGHKVRFRRGDIVEDNVREQVPKDRMSDGQDGKKEQGADKPAEGLGGSVKVPTVNEVLDAWKSSNMAKAEKKISQNLDDIKEGDDDYKILKLAYDEDWENTNAVYKGIRNEKIIEEAIKNNRFSESDKNPSAVTASAEVASTFGMTFIMPKDKVVLKDPKDLLYDGEDVNEFHDAHQLSLLEKRMPPKYPIPDGTVLMIPSFQSDKLGDIQALIKKYKSNIRVVVQER